MPLVACARPRDSHNGGVGGLLRILVVAALVAGLFSPSAASHAPPLSDDVWLSAPDATPPRALAPSRVIEIRYAEPVAPRTLTVLAFAPKTSPPLTA